jgi:hypothetical protein
MMIDSAEEAIREIDSFDVQYLVFFECICRARATLTCGRQHSVACGMQPGGEFFPGQLKK